MYQLTAAAHELLDTHQAAPGLTGLRWISVPDGNQAVQELLTLGYIEPAPQAMRLATYGRDAYLLTPAGIHVTNSPNRPPSRS